MEYKPYIIDTLRKHAPKTFSCFARRNRGHRDNIRGRNTCGDSWELAIGSKHLQTPTNTPMTRKLLANARAQKETGNAVQTLHYHVNTPNAENWFLWRALEDMI